MNKLQVPENVGAAIKALAQGIARPDQQLLAYVWILDNLCGLDGSEAMLGALPAAAETMGWYAGRRFVGLELKDIVAEPLPGSVVDVERLPASRTGRGRT